MPKKFAQTQIQLLAANEELKARLDEAEGTLRAIRNGEVDALIVPGLDGDQVFTLKGADTIYRMLIEDMNEGALTLTADGMILYANRHFAEMLKTPLEKVIGSAIYTWITPDSQRFLKSLLRKSVDKKRSEQLALTASDGTRVPVYLSVSKLLNNEMLDSFCLVATDLTEQKRNDGILASEKLARELLEDSNQARLELLSVVENLKQAEEALRESERELKDAQSLGRFGNWSYDVESQTIAWSDQVYQLYERDLALGPPTPEEEEATYYSPEQAKLMREYTARAIKEGKSFDYDLEVNLPTGKHFYFSAKMRPVRDVNGRVVKLFGTIQDITERKQAEEEIQSRTEELSTLYQLSRALSDANELKRVIELVNRHAVESIHNTFAFITLLEEGILVPRAVYPIRNMGLDFSLGDRQPITALPVCQRVLDKNEPVVLQADSAEVGSAERAILLLDFAQSVCLVPLWVGDPSQNLSQALGLLILGETREEKREPFTPEKIRLARSIGDQAAAAIRRLLLGEQAERRLKHLASLSEIDRSIASNFDLNISLDLILRHASEQLEADAADVLVFNDHLQTLEFAAGRGFNSPAIKGTRLKLGQGQAGQAALERRIIQIPDVAASGAIFAQYELMKPEQVAAYFAVPLITKGQLMGVLEIHHRTPLTPNEEWLDFLKTLAGQAAIAIDNAQLVESLQRSNTELGLAYDATIEGWSHALDLRDKETEGHTLRVAEMTVNLARSLGLSDAELVQVRWGGLLHDIGKMGVPDGILLKPGPLTDEEWVVMKRHPLFAFEMLSSIRYLRGALDIPYCHHEKWDGSGYPRGLKGEQIPLTARIFAVVDVWDALTSDRPYRKAWSEEKTCQHIQAGAGTHFDPQVVKIFLLERR